MILAIKITDLFTLPSHQRKKKTEIFLGKY